MNSQENNEESSHKIKENDEKLIDNSSQNTFLFWHFKCYPHMEM